MQTTGGGYLIAGETFDMLGASLQDMLLVRTNALGEVPDCDACRTINPFISTPVISETSPDVTTYLIYGFPSYTHTLEPASPSPDIAFLCDSWMKSIFLPLVVR